MNIPRKLKKRFKNNINSFVFNRKDNVHYKFLIFSNVVTVKTCLKTGYSNALDWLIKEYPENKNLFEFKNK